MASASPPSPSGELSKPIVLLLGLIAGVLVAIAFDSRAKPQPPQNPSACKRDGSCVPDPKTPNRKSGEVGAIK